MDDFNMHIFILIINIWILINGGNEKSGVLFNLFKTQTNLEKKYSNIFIWINANSDSADSGLNSLLSGTWTTDWFIRRNE